MESHATWLKEELDIESLLAAPGSNRASDQLLSRLYAYARSITSAGRAGPTMPSDDCIASAQRWLARPVFICGHHRSGTTLVQRLLDGHPQLIVLPSEATFFDSFRDVARVNPAAHAVDRFVTEWIARLIDPNQAPHFKLGRSTAGFNPYFNFASSMLGWGAALQANAGRFTWLLALVAAFSETRAAARPVCWVEKTPLNEHRVHEFEPLTHARYLHVVRDPRATLASLLAAYRRADLDAPATVRIVRAMAHSMSAAAKHSRQSPNRYLVIRYEDLIEKPASEIARVAQFIGIGNDRTLLTPTDCGYAVAPNSSFFMGVTGGIERVAARPPLARPLEQLVDAVVGEIASEFGYDFPRAPRIQRIAVVAREVARAAKERTYRRT